MRCRALTRKGAPCRRSAIDASGYCRAHHTDKHVRPTDGSVFEVNCLKVLRLLGYSVHQDVAVSGCQIDVFAEYCTGIIPLRLMVECKDYGTDRNVGVAEVKEFAGILNTARGRAVDKGLLIASSGFTRAARAFAEVAGIQLVCFSELATQLVPFDDYIDRIISEYESMRVSQCYIALSVSFTEDYDLDQSVIERPLDNVVSKLLFDENHTKVALLGNFGTGKSTFCKKFAYDLARRYKSDRTQRIPIVVNLSDYESKLDIQELVTNTLQFRYNVRIDLTICQELQRLGRFLLLLDGFDEMATRVDPDIIRDNLREIEKISRIPENKFLMTCRTHFFRDRVQAEILADFDLLFIPEWGEQELAEYLRNRLGAQWRKHLDRIHGTHNLTELAQTPLFMEMIVETLPELGSSVRRAALYKVYTDRWIREQSRRRGSRLSSIEREAVVKELSQRMFLEDKNACHYAEFAPIIAGRFKTIDAAQIDYLESDVRTCTFLIRDRDGQYRFRHRSFMEYFVAQSIADEIAHRESRVLASKLLPVDVRGFLVDMLRDEPPADLLREWLRNATHEVMCDNCLSVASALRIDLADTPLGAAPAAEFDARLFANFLQGAPQAFDALFRELRDPLWVHIRRKLQGSGGSDVVDDIVAETFVRLWQNRDRVERVQNVRAFALAIASNLVIDYFRRMHREKFATFDDIADEQLPTAEVSGSAIQATFDVAIQQLSAREQRVVRGVVAGNMTMAEMAEELEVSVSAVRRMRARALRKLREQLKGGD